MIGNRKIMDWKLGKIWEERAKELTPGSSK